MTEYTVEDALAEIGDLIRCRCHPAYKDRKMHDPECHCDSAEAVSTVAAEVARLTAERDALQSEVTQTLACNRGLVRLNEATQARAEKAEAERDALRQTLRNIAEGNLGDAPWQANYARIRHVAAVALDPNAK